MNIIEAKMSRFNVDSSNNVELSTLAHSSDMLPTTLMADDEVDEFSR